MRERFSFNMWVLFGVVLVIMFLTNFCLVRVVLFKLMFGMVEGGRERVEENGWCGVICNLCLVYVIM